jgi:hypothetical protein
MKVAMPTRWRDSTIAGKSCIAQVLNLVAFVLCHQLTE